MSIDISSGVGGRDPRFLGGRFVESPLNIIISYNVQEYEMRTLSKVVTFQNKKDLCILNGNSWMISSILCYVPPSVELLGLTTPQFLNPVPRPPVFKPD